MIAPRNLIIVAGQKDGIFPIDGVRRAYKTVEKIYKKAGCKNNCRLIETPQKHWWCEDIIWSAIQEEVKKLGWNE